MIKLFRILLSVILVTGCVSTATIKSAKVGTDQASVYEIGNNTIQIPAEWQLQHYPMPTFAGMPNPINIRVFGKDIEIAITGIPLKKPVTTSAQEELEYAIIEGSTPYISLSSEGKVHLINASSAGILFGYATFTCAGNKQCFPVFAGEPFRSVTIALIKSNAMQYTVSIGNNSVDSKELALAIESLKSIGK